MEPEATDRLVKAERNRDIAQRLSDSAVHHALGIEPPPLEWAVVAAFYAAVHYVNAYLWEKLGSEPHTHDERERLVHTITDLKPIAPHYSRLQGQGWSARYLPRYQISQADAAQIVRVDLGAIEARIKQLM